MNDVAKHERATQNRVIALFEKDLRYTYLGDWTDRPNNSNVEEAILSAWLTKRGYSAETISRALYELGNVARNPARKLYQNNLEVYKLLRYGVPIKAEAGQKTESVWLIDWEHPDNNEFGIAEEVTLSGNHDRRPDLVLYVNGIALGVIELKRSIVSVGEGIRQNLSNQSDQFHPWFFSTIQYVFAGNDSEGLRYGTIKTPEKFFLTWKEDEADNSGYKLDKYLLKMCEKSRFLEVIHDFVLFDAGTKKIPRPHQYFAVKATQQRIAGGEGGIIWHTQGSGKSIVMVLVAKWLLEHNPNARILVVTDRDELDKQIEGVFKSVGEEMRRTTSGSDLMRLLVAPTPRLICTLVHKFGPKGSESFDDYLKQLANTNVPSVGDFYVFIDEAHRSHTGKFNEALKGVLPRAVFIGFTGTPLLKKDASSIAVFGTYIHTYKIKEAVKDHVVLDLEYEARDIDQRLGSPEKVDQYFDAKTRGLNKWQRDELEKRWATKQKVLSSKSRMDKVVNDIALDFDTRERLASGRGNAILVASSIYEACRYFQLFQDTELRGHCAIVTSYDPYIGDIKLEETGANTDTEKQFIYKTYDNLLQNVSPQPGKTKTETYEDEAKDTFVNEPANTRLIIVVYKLLTGFDAPPCSVIYIDKRMQDHGLFQAICRTNRLDDDSKVAGTIVDYKGLFKEVAGAVAVYSSELDHSAPGSPPEILIRSRIDGAKERIADALETLFHLEEPIERPLSDLNYQRYFCGNSEIESDLEMTRVRREALYHGVVTLVRAISGISDEWSDSGYTQDEIADILKRQDHFVKVRDFVRLSSGEQLDLKPYESDMRRLIDMYIEADPSREIFSTNDMGLLEILDLMGAKHTVERIEESIESNAIADHEVAAEIIENNIRKKIVKSKISDPEYYKTMSSLLHQVIADRKEGALEYEQYLKRIEEIAREANNGRLDSTPSALDTPGKRALWNNLSQNEALALQVHNAILTNRPDSWHGNPAKENKIRRAIFDVLKNPNEVERIFAIVREQGEYA